MLGFCLKEKFELFNEMIVMAKPSINPNARFRKGRNRALPLMIGFKGEEVLEFPKRFIFYQI